LKPSLDYFSSDALKTGLKAKTIRGGKATGVAQVLRMLIGLAAIPLLARLLDPEDFGLLAMVMYLAQV